MNVVDDVLWFFPLVLVAVGFLTSRIKGFKFGRLAIYVVVFLAAFLLDLLATSFKQDVLDSIFSLIVLMVFADLFWKIIRLKTKIVRVVGLLTGMVLFIIFYGSWVVSGPKGMAVKLSTEIVSYYKNGKHSYYIKKRQAVEDTVVKPEYVLFKVRGFSLLEQYCNKYSLPEGYENAIVSFNWKKRGDITEVNIIGDSDTLWNLNSDIKPK